MRPGPLRLAAYIEESASCRSDSPPAVSPTVTPTLAEIRTSWPSTVNGLATAARICPATCATSSALRTCSQRITNSSPPTRVAVSPTRVTPSNRAATWRRRSSPTSCP